MIRSNEKINVLLEFTTQYKLIDEMVKKAWDRYMQAIDNDNIKFDEPCGDSRIQCWTIQDSTFLIFWANRYDNDCGVTNMDVRYIIEGL